MKKQLIGVNPFFIARIYNSIILTDSDKKNFSKFIKYMTQSEKCELLKII